VPSGVVLLLINVGLIVHAAKTGRFWPWGYIILSSALMQQVKLANS
jgi:hypothetical protein